MEEEIDVQNDRGKDMGKSHAFTYLNKSTNLFKVINVPFIDDINAYCKLVYAAANEQIFIMWMLLW